MDAVNSEPMHTLWNTLQKASQELALFYEPADMQISAGPPAEEVQLTALAHHLGIALPPSYCAFLALHNGVDPLYGTMRLFTTEELIKGIIESEDVADLYPELGGFVFAGGDKSYETLCFDPAVRSTKGELEVVHLDAAMNQSRYPSFMDFLQDCSQQLQKALDTERKDRESLSE